MLKDVGIILPKSRETSAVYMQGMRACNNNMHNPKKGCREGCGQGDSPPEGDVVALLTTFSGVASCPRSLRDLRVGL